MIRNCSKLFFFAAHAAALACGVLPSLAGAAPTAINALGAGNGSERCLVGSFCASGGTYGGSLSLIAILEKDLGLGAFQRVDDSIDKVWQNLGGGQVLAVGRYAGDSSRLGIDATSGFQALTGAVASGKIQVTHDSSFFNDSRPGDFIKVTSPSWTTIPVGTGSSFALVLDDLTTGYRISSDPSRSGYANSGRSGLDYMVTFLVPDSKPHYLVAWEDRDPRNGTTGDGDYNDFIAELVFSQPAAFSIAAVPEPGSFALLVAGFIAIAWVRRKRIPPATACRRTPRRTAAA